MCDRQYSLVLSQCKKFIMSSKASFNEDQFVVSELEDIVRIENISGSSNVLRENHAGGETRGGASLYSSSSSLANDIDIHSPLLIHLSEAMNESADEHTEHANPALVVPVSAPPPNQLFQSLMVPMEQEQNFMTVDQPDGMNFEIQNQPMMPINTFHPDNSFQMDTHLINDQAFSLYDPANNGFGYLPSPNGLPEWQNQAGRVQISPFNPPGNSQIGVGIHNNGTNFVDGSANWVHMHDNTFGSQDIQFQHDLNVGMDEQGSFNLGGSTPNPVQFPNVPYNMDGNQGSNFVNNNLPNAGQSSSMEMTWNMQNGTTLASELGQEGFYDRNGDYISNRQQKRLMSNSVYDPMYDAPLDPHLRIFLSQRGHDGPENPAEKTNNDGGNI